MTGRGRPALPPAYHFGRLIAVAEAAAGLPMGKLVNNSLSNPPSLAKLNPTIVQDRDMNTRAERIASNLTDGWPAQLDNAQQGDALSGYHAERAAIIRAREVGKLRRESGLARPAFAGRIGVSARTLEGWEQHRQDVPHDIPDRIRQALAAVD